MPDDLTPTQSRVLDYIATHIVERQRPPTRKDIAAHFGWSSANAAEDVMQVLVRKAVLMEYGRRARELGLPWRQ